MCFFFSFVPATFWLVLGYFILYSAARADGGVAKFGRILAIWVFIIAACIPLMAAWVTFNDLCPLAAVFERLHGR